MRKINWTTALGWLGIIIVYTLIIIGACFVVTNYCHCQEESEEPDLAFEFLKKTAITVNIIDTWTTFGLLQSDLYIESNPLWAPIIHNQGLVLALDFGIALGIEYGFDLLYDWSEPMAYVFLGALILAEGYCVVNNWELLRR